MEEIKKEQNEITQQKESKNKKKDPLQRLITEEQAVVIEKSFRKSAFFLRIMNIFIIIEIVLSILAVILFNLVPVEWIKIVLIVILSVVGGGILSMFTTVLVIHLQLRKYLKSINVDYKEFKNALKS